MPTRGRSHDRATDPQTALAQLRRRAAFMRITCDRCGKDRMLNEAHIPVSGAFLRGAVAPLLAVRHASSPRRAPWRLANAGQIRRYPGLSWAATGRRGACADRLALLQTKACAKAQAGDGWGRGLTVCGLGLSRRRRRSPPCMPPSARNRRLPQTSSRGHPGSSGLSPLGSLQPRQATLLG